MSLPAWLSSRLAAAGGRVPFSTYMEWVLHDPDHGAYGSGQLRIGPQGDFATAPSLGADFAALLAPQIASWLRSLPVGSGISGLESAEEFPFAVVETGPGEGHLAAQLAEALVAGWPQLAARTELVLVEPNQGMAARQRAHLAACPMAVRWASFTDLAAAPVQGVVLAHEVLDALAVERIVRCGPAWCRQVVALHEPEEIRLEAGEPLGGTWSAPLAALGLLPMVEERGEGWCTELHPSLLPWLEDCARSLRCGRLLVIDYALEAWRYYAAQRSRGTLLAYRGQRVSADPLLDPGQWDLTAHLCLDTLIDQALCAGWRLLGHRRQGEALLALGLAERLHSLQQGEGHDLAELLRRREALLRLVDPTALGDFRWVAFERAPQPLENPELPADVALFLRDP